MPMQPYVIKQGDYLALLAYKFGFVADTVWNDPQNAALRQLRPDPNILSPTDILYIPDSASNPPASQSLANGQTNSFVTSSPTVNITLKFVNPELASQPVSVVELPALNGLTTGADGTITIAVPMTQQSVTLLFASDATTFTCSVGGLDPINTVSGVAQRLQHLGYLEPAAEFGLADLDTVRDALRTFRATQPGARSPSTPPASESAPASDPPPSGMPAPDSSRPPGSDPPPPPDSSAPASSQGPRELGVSDPNDVPSAPASQGTPPSTASPPPSSGPPPSSAPPPSSGALPSAPVSSAPAAANSTPSEPPPSSAPGASPDSGSGSDSAPTDDAGMDDNGVLDAATTALLVQAHGS